MTLPRLSMVQLSSRYAERDLPLKVQPVYYLAQLAQ